jgi:hypothetical protein
MGLQPALPVAPPAHLLKPLFCGFKGVLFQSVFDDLVFEQCPESNARPKPRHVGVPSANVVSRARISSHLWEETTPSQQHLLTD